MKIHVYGAATQLLSLSSRHLPPGSSEAMVFSKGGVRGEGALVARQEDVGIFEKSGATRLAKWGRGGVQRR